MTKSTIANTLARGIRQQMPFYTGFKLSMKRWIVVRLLLDCSLISQRDLILYLPRHWCKSWPNWKSILSS